jgi:PAS domain S-box-containing protein
MKNKNTSTETEKIKAKNAELQQQLKELKDSIRTSNIDALIIPDKKNIKIFTEKTADKTYRILVEKMNEGAVTLNERGTIIYCNSHFANMMNLPLQKAIGTKFTKFIKDSKKEYFSDLIKKARNGAIKSELNLYSSDGKKMPVLMGITDLNLKDTFAVSMIITDLTDQKKEQEKLTSRTRQLEQKNKELAKANKDLLSFTYISSHDLQEPLRKIQNFSIAILLEEEKNLSKIGKVYFQQMQKTAKRMQSLIEDLLTYSRAKDTNIAFEKTNLDSILKELLKDFEEDITKKKVVIKIKPLGSFKVIPFQFRQLLQNFISNSLKFSNREKKSKICIEGELIRGDKTINKNLSGSKKYLHIIFEDNGIGFEPQYKDRIFEVFQQLHTRDKYKGTGIGLAICKRIVENHHGIITATGALGKGARFDIYIPA